VVQRILVADARQEKVDRVLWPSICGGRRPGGAALLQRRGERAALRPSQIGGSRSRAREGMNTGRAQEGMNREIQSILVRGIMGSSGSQKKKLVKFAKF